MSGRKSAKPRQPKQKPPARGQNSPRSPKMALAKTREAEALRLRTQGYTYDRIRKTMGISLAAAHDAVARALAELSMSVAEKAEEVRALELDRLDAALAAIWPRVEKGDDGAVRSMLAIQQRRASLLGLDRADPTPLPPPGPAQPSSGPEVRIPAFVVMSAAEVDSIRAEKAAEHASRQPADPDRV